MGVRGGRGGRGTLWGRTGPNAYQHAMGKALSGDLSGFGGGITNFANGGISFYSYSGGAGGGSSKGSSAQKGFAAIANDVGRYSNQIGILTAALSTMPGLGYDFSAMDNALNLTGTISVDGDGSFSSMGLESTNNNGNGVIALEQENGFTPVIVNLTAKNAFSTMLDNMKYVHLGGTFNTREMITLPGTERMTGGNWFDRNIGNAIGNYFLGAFGSFYTDREGYMENGNVYWRVFDQDDAFDGANIGYWIDNQTNRNAPSGYPYQLMMRSHYDDNVIFLFGFKNRDLFFDAKDYIDGK